MDAIKSSLDVKWLTVPLAIAAHVAFSLALGASIRRVPIAWADQWPMAADGLKGAVAIVLVTFAAYPLAKLADRYSHGA